MLTWWLIPLRTYIRPVVPRPSPPLSMTGMHLHESESLIRVDRHTHQRRCIIHKDSLIIGNPRVSESETRLNYVSPEIILPQARHGSHGHVIMF